MSDTHIFEEGRFFGCYLLCSLNPKFKGRTYIGFTVNPNRRINQHNSGYAKGGAKRTSGKGPWEMVLIIHGFPNEISALRFEWAWQNPEKSLRLKHLVPQTKQYNFIFKFSVVCEMLRIGPWCRLPLTIRWLKQEYRREFQLNKLPPAHMPIEFGLVQIIAKSKSKKAALATAENEELVMSQRLTDICFICELNISNSTLEVLNKNLATIKCIKCLTPFHTLCLSNNFISNSNQEKQLIPIEGNCPKCNSHLMWGDLVKFRLDLYKTNSITASQFSNLDNADTEDDEEDFVERDDSEEEDNSQSNYDYE